MTSRKQPTALELYLNKHDNKNRSQSPPRQSNLPYKYSPST